MLTIKENIDLKTYNTFGVSVCGRMMVESDDAGELLAFLGSERLSPEDLLVLGGGSNLLFTSDFSGIIFYPRMADCEIMGEDAEYVDIRVGAGMVWDHLVEWTVSRGWGGLENLSHIPGHVGATPVQNIGAYGVEVGDRIVRVEAVDLVQGKRVELEHSMFDFGYRHSIFKQEWKNRFIITSVVFRLDKHPQLVLDYGHLRQELGENGLTPAGVREAVIRIRQSKLPEVEELPNAGSFFKNPVVDNELAASLKEKYPAIPVYPAADGQVKLAAGWLIEAAGWKGRSLGHAAVHDKQALVLVNLGGATGLEIVHLANEVKKAVFMQFGIWLEPEVNII